MKLSRRDFLKSFVATVVALPLVDKLRPMVAGVDLAHGADATAIVPIKIHNSLPDIRAYWGQHVIIERDGKLWETHNFHDDVLEWTETTTLPLFNADDDIVLFE